MTNLDELIEDNENGEFKIFEREVGKLTQEQLERLVVEEGVYKAEVASGSDRDSLEIGAAEVSWREFFKAYRAVVGKPFPLDE